MVFHEMEPDSLKATYNIEIAAVVELLWIIIEEMTQCKGFC